MAVATKLKIFPLTLDWARPIGSKPSWITSVEEGVDGSELRSALSSHEWLEMVAGVRAMTAVEAEQLRIWYQTLDIDEVLIPLPQSASASLDRDHLPTSRILWLNYLGGMPANVTDVQITRPDGTFILAAVNSWNELGVSAQIETWVEFRNPIGELGLPPYLSSFHPFGCLISGLGRGRFAEPPKIQRVTDEHFEAEIVFRLRRPRGGTAAPVAARETWTWSDPLIPPPGDGDDDDEDDDDDDEPDDGEVAQPPSPIELLVQISGVPPVFGVHNELFTASPNEANATVKLNGDTNNYAIRIKVTTFCGGVPITGGQLLAAEAKKGGTMAITNLQDEYCKLEVDHPAETYWLNANGRHPRQVVQELEIEARGNARLILRLGTAANGENDYPNPDDHEVEVSAEGHFVMIGTFQFARIETLGIRLLEPGESAGTDSEGEPN